MTSFQSLTKLYTKRQQQKREFSHLGWESYHRQYLRRFWQQQKSLIVKVVWLSLLAIAIEVFIFLIARIVIRQLSLQLNIVGLWWVVIILCVVVLFYLLLSYFSIIFEKKLLITLLNDLRQLWFKRILRSSPLSIQEETKQTVIAKVSYHFSLLTMGFNNALIGIWRAILIIVVVLLLSAFIGWQMFVWGVVAILLAIGLFVLGYQIALNYVGREQTFYTQIIKHMLKIFYDLPNYQLHHREGLAVKKFNRLVELDSWFRVRRDVWMKYGSDILFVLILLGGAILYIAQLYWPHIFKQEVASLFFYGIVITYIVRLLYLSLRAGLFYVPLRLGLWLSIPDKKPAQPKKFSRINNICFRAEKFKLLDGDGYFGGKFCFNQGKSYLLTNGNRERLDVLAKIFTGLSLQRTKPWVLSVNNQRYLYKDWFKYHTPNYFISPLWQFQGTVGEFLLNKSEENIQPQDVEQIYDLLARHDAWQFIFRHSKALAKNISISAPSLLEKGILQIAYAIVHKLDFVIIDSCLIDLQSANFVATINLLRQQVPSCIILIMSTGDNQILDYEEKFLLQTK